MVYLTYNDNPSGIYSSQVIDVVNYINGFGGEKIRLVALISARNFKANKQSIKKSCPGAVVMPMVPKAKNWKLNIATLYLFFLFNPTKKIMARGPFATNLALKLKAWGLVKKIVFDARGAYAAELTEYDVVQDQSVKAAIRGIEQHALLQSDQRLAVSGALVEYWKREFGYNSQAHVVIPCTLSRHFEFELPSAAEIADTRQKLGYSASDILFIYSGSSAGWQSFELVDESMVQLMEKNAHVKLVILSGHFDERYRVIKQFKDRVLVTWLPQEQVKHYLLAADYGILYREQSVTNEVASPVKFAEYLSCGLKVMISEKLGDYTVFSEQHQCRFSEAQLATVPYSEKARIHALAPAFFYKSVYKPQYLQLVNG